MTILEPYRLSMHSIEIVQLSCVYYTCARPGRSLGPKQNKINDEVVHAWVQGITKNMQIPVEGEVAIISLLGRKPTGLSEFSYYSFHGGFDRAENRLGSPTWQDWLRSAYGDRYCVYEFPTEDLKPLTEEMKRAVITRLRDLVECGKSVVIVDSGGVGRTGSIVHAVSSGSSPSKSKGSNETTCNLALSRITRTGLRAEISEDSLASPKRSPSI